MKDRISLIAAAAGGFMLSIAIAGIIKAAPVTSLPVQSSANSNPTTELQLQPIHPDESVNYTLEQRFSLENSLTALGQIKGALNSFRQLTETNKTSLGNVGNTDWETQNLGFFNWVGAVEGTLNKQNYQIKQLEYELAQTQYQDGKIAQAILNQKLAEYQQAKHNFVAFWQSFKIAD